MQLTLALGQQVPATVCHRFTFKDTIQRQTTVIQGGAFHPRSNDVPNSFMVKIGDKIKEGAPLALLGISGNSDLPHLQFQISDGPDILFSNGLPFVLKKYIKIFDQDVGPVAPIEINNSMMEEFTVMNF